MDWLSGDRADIDQEGLLAERTLRIAPRASRPDDPGAGAGAADENRDHAG